MAALRAITEAIRAVREAGGQVSLRSSVSGLEHAATIGRTPKKAPKRKARRKPTAAKCVVKPAPKHTSKRKGRKSAVHASASHPATCAPARISSVRPTKKKPAPIATKASAPPSTPTRKPIGPATGGTSGTVAGAAGATLTPTSPVVNPPTVTVTPPVSTPPVVSGGGPVLPSAPFFYAPLGAVGGDTGWVNVMSYGAHGDGSADDTAALNAACTAARQINVDGGAAVVYLPAGVYNVSAPINVFDIFLRGDGMAATKIQATSDWASGGPNTSWMLDQQPSTAGVGKPAAGTGGVGPAPTTGTFLEDLWLSGPGQASPGSLSCNLSGVRIGQGAGYQRLHIEGFFAGAFLSGGEEKLLGPGKLTGNYYGVYSGGPSASVGDQVIADLEIEGSAWAAIGVASGASFQRTAFRSLHLLSSPFGIYKEEAAAGDVLLTDCVLANVHFDQCGNGNIFVNGPAGGGADVVSCVFESTLSDGALSGPATIATSSRDARGRAIGRSLAPIDLLGGSWVENEVQGSDPTALPSGGSPAYSAMVACGRFSGGRYGPGGSAIARVVQDGTRFTTGNCAGDALVVGQGSSCRLLPAAGSGIRPGDLVEIASGSQFGVARSTGARRALGVAVHAGNAGDTVPVAFSGIVTVNCGGNAIAADDPLKADPNTLGGVITAALSDPAVIGVAQSASSSGTVQAFLQSL